MKERQQKQYQSLPAQIQRAKKLQTPQFRCDNVIHQNKVVQNAQQTYISPIKPYSEWSLAQLKKQLLIKKQIINKIAQYQLKLRPQTTLQTMDKSEDYDTMHTSIVNDQYAYDYSNDTNQYFSLVFLLDLNTVLPTVNTNYVWINKENKEQTAYFNQFNKYLRLHNMFKVQNVHQFVQLFAKFKNNNYEIWVENVADLQQLINWKIQINQTLQAENQIQIYFVSKDLKSLDQYLQQNKYNPIFFKTNFFSLTKMGQLIQKTASKLSQDNFVYIIGENDQQSQILRKVLFAMINQKTNKKQIVQKFLQLAKHYIIMQQYEKTEKQIIKLQQDCQLIVKSNFDPKVVLHIYTKDNYLYRIMNNILRKSNKNRTFNILQVYYIQPFIQAMAKGIQYSYSQEVQTKNFQCFRGGYLRREEIKKLSTNVGSYIQTLGFLSTSLCEQLASSFCFNSQIIINVQANQKECRKCCSYIFMDNFSYYSYEDQVLFMPLSRFKIQKVKNFQNLVHKSYHKIQVYLKYITICKCETKTQKKYLCQGDIFQQFDQFQEIHKKYMSKTISLYKPKLVKQIQNISEEIKKRKEDNAENGKTQISQLPRQNWSQLNIIFF